MKTAGIPATAHALRGLSPQAHRHLNLMTLVPSNLPPHDSSPPSGGEDDDVQHVRVMRSGSVTAEVGDGASVTVVSSFGAKAAAVVVTGKQTFFRTFKWTMLLGVLLAVLAAWYAEGPIVLRGVLTALLVVVPAAGAAVALAGRLAAAALAVETWRQTGLVGQVLDTPARPGRPPRRRRVGRRPADGHRRGPAATARPAAAVRRPAAPDASRRSVGGRRGATVGGGDVNLGRWRAAGPGAAVDRGARRASHPTRVSAVGQGRAGRLGRGAGGLARPGRRPW